MSHRTPSTPHASDKRELLSDVKALCQRARTHMDAGAVTEGYQADRDTVVRLLNTALATELICALRYRRHHFTAEER